MGQNLNDHHFLPACTVCCVRTGRVQQHTPPGSCDRGVGATFGARSCPLLPLHTQAGRNRSPSGCVSAQQAWQTKQQHRRWSQLTRRQLATAGERMLVLRLVKAM